MAPNVSDVSAIDGAEIASLVAIDAPKFPPLTEGLFALPSPAPGRKLNAPFGVSTATNEDDSVSQVSESAGESIFKEEESRPVLLVDDIVDNLIKAAKDAEANSEKQYTCAEHIQDSYWDESTEVILDSDDENDTDGYHLDKFTVGELEVGLLRDAARRRGSAARQHCPISDVDSESHKHANYWFWKANESNEQSALHQEPELVTRYDVNKLLSVLAIEANLIKETEERLNNRYKQHVDGACDDAYWAWNDKSLKASLDPSSWDAYWDFEATVRDAIVYQILRNEEARQSVSGERIESDLLRESKDREESKRVDVNGCSDDAYWS